VGVSPRDSGQYICVATNAIGRAETRASVRVMARSDIVTESDHEAAMQQISYLEGQKTQIQQEEQIVRQPPTFTKPLRNIEVVEGNNVHMEARLMPTGDSTMTLEWTVNGKPLKTGACEV